MDKLLDFVSSHATLKTVALFNSILVECTTDEFLEIYEKIVTAISKNTSIVDLRIRFNLSLTPATMPAFMAEVSRISAILEGRKLSICGVPIERVIRDLVNAVPVSGIQAAGNGMGLLIGGTQMYFMSDI